MKRQKRKYLILIILSVVLAFSIAILYTAVKRAFTFGETQATIVSVETKERQGGTSGDYYYYTESDITCSYTVNGHIYIKAYTIKADYSNKVGSSIIILYDKSNPYVSVIGTHKITAVFSSALLTIGLIYLIFWDISKWVKIRKKENENILQVAFPEDNQQCEEKKQQKIVNIILIILSILLFLPLSVLGISLIIFTIARIIDYRMCYKTASTM